MKGLTPPKSPIKVALIYLAMCVIQSWTSSPYRCDFTVLMFPDNVMVLILKSDPP